MRSPCGMRILSVVFMFSKSKIFYSLQSVNVLSARIFIDHNHRSLICWSYLFRSSTYVWNSNAFIYSPPAVMILSVIEIIKLWFSLLTYLLLWTGIQFEFVLSFNYLKAGFVLRWSDGMLFLLVPTSSTQSCSAYIILLYTMDLLNTWIVFLFLCWRKPLLSYCLEHYYNSLHEPKQGGGVFLAIVYSVCRFSSDKFPSVSTTCQHLCWWDAECTLMLQKIF